MENVNIISEENEVKSNWLKLENVGEEFQGTLVDKHNSVDSYGKDQIVYEFLMEDGQIRPYGTSKKAINVQMKYVKLGQIVGMKFIEKTPSSNPNFKDTHIIKVFANPDIVNQEWLESREEEKIESSPQSMEEISEQMPESEIPTPAPAVVGGVTAAAPVATVAPATTVDPVEQINELAKTKLLVMDVTIVKQAVQEVTTLAFIPTNYAKIIELLTAMPDKAAIV